MTLPRARSTSIRAARALSRNGWAWTTARAACSASGQRGPAELGAGERERLQRLRPQVGEFGALAVDPRRLEPGQQAALGDLDGLPGGLPRLLGRGRAGLAQARGRDLPVDPRVLGQVELELGATVQDARAERLAQARERRREQRLVRGRSALARPQRLRELVAADRPLPVQREIGEQEPALSSAQRVFEPPSLELHDESTAQLDAGRFPHDHARNLSGSSVVCIILEGFW